jgi:hypothetical protein
MAILLSCEQYQYGKYYFGCYIVNDFISASVIVSFYHGLASIVIDDEKRNSIHK